MPTFTITTKRKNDFGGVHLEKGMSVQVVTKTNYNPLTNDQQAVIDAFMRIYGVDLKKANALTPSYLDVVKVN